MTLAAGSKLSFYEVLAPLGAGAMGEVWRAKDTKLGREVAIKVLPEVFASDEERLRRFEREAKTLATVNHPNVAQIFGVDRVGETSFLVLELVPGESLADRLKRGPLPLEEAIDVCKQIAEGLEAAHEAGVIHRDLKPANIRITPEGKVKLLDFGLAKPVRADGDTQDSTDSVLSTEAGRLLGTPTYMAPEQARGKPTDKRVDIWAFGCVLYECLTKKRAFAGATMADVLGAVMHTEPDWKSLPSDTPPHIRELIARCLAKDPHQRLRDVGDARISLQSRAPDAGAASRVRKLPTILIACVALLAGAAGTAAWMTRNAPPPRPESFIKLNQQTEAIFRARFGPDGATVVYSAARAGNTPEVYVVRPESPEPRALGLPDTQLLAVSARGELALLTGARYVDHNVFTGTLARVPLGGGAPREILEKVREADWSADGSELAIIREVGGKDRLEFPIGNVLCEVNGYLSDLRFSPAGDRIAYFEHPFRWDDRGSLNVVDLKGRSSVLSDGYWAEEGIAWSADGREILFSAGIDGRTSPVYASTLDGKRRIAFAGPGLLTIRDQSRAGRWLTTRDTFSQACLARLPDLDRDRDLSWLDGSGSGILTQDARTIVLDEAGHAAGPFYAVGVRKTDGSPVVRLGDGSPYDISRDGKWVLAGVSSTPPRLVLYPIGPGEPRVLERGSLESFADGRCFRDGTRVLVLAAMPGRGTRYYVLEVRGGAPLPVTPEGTRDGLLSPDERRILARGPSGAYFLYPIEGGEGQPAPGLSEEDQLVHWSADGRSVLTRSGNAVPFRLERVELESGRREFFRDMTPDEPAGVLTVYGLRFTDDERAYAFGVMREISGLFVSEAIR